MSDRQTITADTVIIGGGVAALWTANVLKNSGHSIAVLTNSPLGSDQTLAAQGVIHGGLKYAVAGKLTDSSEALADMPSRWLSAMRGEGPVDLTGASLLSDHQVMWSLPGLLSKTVSFFGSKALRGRSAALPREEYPEVFRTEKYRGTLFRIEEPVIDPVSIMEALALGVEEYTWLVDWDQNAELISEGKEISGVALRSLNGEETFLKATQFILAAGAGNGDFLKKLEIESPQMQRRPLHQLIIRKDDLPDFYSVCVGSGPKPPLVSTTHTDSQGRKIWYIGGDIAEQSGVARNEEEQIEAGKALFKKLLPWVDLADAEWFTWLGDRAEPYTGTGDRPAGAFVRRVGNVLVTWPTKLALAPHLADQVLAEAATPSQHDSLELGLPRPSLAKPPWDRP